MSTKSFKVIPCKKSNAFAFLSLFILILTGCEQFFPDWDDIGEKGVYVNNLSNDSIIVLASVADNPWGITYPDTTLPERIIVDETQSLARMCWPPKSYDVIWYGSHRDKYFGESLSHSRDTLMLTIVLKDTLDKYGWIDVCRNYRVAVRYELSSSEVKQIRYMIPYPPQSFIHGMKMYPPYSHFQRNQ